MSPAAATVAAERPRPWWPGEAVDAVRLGLTVVAALTLAMFLELSRPEWAGWTVLSVSLATRADSLEKAGWRVVSTLVGATASLGLVAAFAQDTLAFDVALALWLGAATFLSRAARRQDVYGFALIGYTVPIVTLADVQRPLSLFDNAVDRCSALLLGVGCAYVSAALVAPDVKMARARLAVRIEATLSACLAWRGGDRSRPPPVDAVFALDAAVVDAFSEQPSLRTGGRPTAEAAPALLGLIASDLLDGRLALARKEAPRSAPDRDRYSADALLDLNRTSSAKRLRQALATARMLREGRRLGRHRVPWRALAADRDWRAAGNDAMRTVAAVSLTSAFWYLSDWSSGAATVTWAALVCVLFASRPSPSRAAFDFLLGAALAELIGLVAHYTILTAPGELTLLATVSFAIGMLGAAGRADRRSVSAGGFSIVVFSALEPTNVMRYDLAASLNDALGTLVGVAVAMFAFTALPPPASEATRRERARRRLAAGLRRASLWPAVLAPHSGRWCAPMMQRAALLAPEGPAALAEAHAVVLAGLLVLALRRRHEVTGRAAGRIVTAGGPNRPDLLAALAERHDRGLQRARLDALAALFAPGAPPADIPPPTTPEDPCSP